MASTQSNSSTLTSGSSPTPLVTINHHIILKLSCDNYPLWHFLMVSFLEEHELFGHVDGFVSCPPKFIIVSNPDYQTW